MSSRTEEQQREGLVLELFEELLDFAPTERAPELTKRLRNRKDAKEITARLQQLFAVEDSMGQLSPGGSLASVAGALAKAESPATALELPQGTAIGGFEVLALIGRGGMGAVYRARQERPQREVALKVLETSESGDPSTLQQRLRHEGDLLARLIHPSIAAIHAMGVEAATPDHAPLPWLAMEYVEGAQDIATHLKGKPRDKVLALFKQVLDAVHFGHQKGVVHRDLKPDNLLVDKDGRLRVIDFGVAGLLRAEGTSEPPQATGGSSEVLGTLPYMAPELLAFDELDSATDIRGDVYSLGVVLFELLLGRKARQLKGLSLAETLVFLREQPIEIPADSGLPNALIWTLQTAVAQNPAQRYSSADAFRRDIEAYLQDRPVEAQLLARPLARNLYATGLFLRRNWGSTLGIAAVLIGLFASLIFSLKSAGGETQEHLRAQKLQGVALEAAAREAVQHLRAEELQAAAIRSSLQLVMDFAGRVANLQGGLETRRDMIQTGLVDLEALVAQADELGPETALALAHAHLAFGDVLGYTRAPNLGDFVGAEEAYGKARGLLHALPSNFADSLEPRLVGARLLEREATLLRAKGDLDGARVAFKFWGEQVMELMPLAEAAGDREASVQLAIDQGQSFSQQGRLVGFAREHEAALALFERAASIFRKLIADTPEGEVPGKARFQLLQALNMIAITQVQMGDVEKSLASFAESGANLDQLILEEPDNSILFRSRAEGTAVEMDVRRRAGDFEGGYKLLESGRTAFATLQSTDPLDARLRNSAATLEALAGELQLDWAEALTRGGKEGAGPHEEEARQLFQGAIALFEALVTSSELAGPARMHLAKTRKNLESLQSEQE